ncbi:MAG: O-antigen ligase family protein [Desulfosporosinus sp.]|nr:O-antigen ligase family protein [Desulfosporosinus sp.]
MLWVILCITILAVGWGWKNSRYLLPLLILSLPLEISKTWFPHLLILDKLGEFVGVIDLGRIFTLAVIVYFVYKLLWSRRADLYFGNARDHLAESFHSPLFVVLGSYLIWGACSVIWSADRLQTLVGAARLILLWLLGAAIYSLVKSKNGRITVPAAFAVVSSSLAVIGVYELFSKHFIWLSEIYQPINRINATFVDANIYARFLLIGCLATAILMLNATREGKLMGTLALAFQIVALIGTGSRTGLVDLIIVALGLAVLVRRREVILPVLGTLALAGISISLSYGLRMRVLELTNFWAASTERKYLVTSGFQMFKQHPLAGIGLGGFPHTMQTTYASLVQNGVINSHTALLTTAAELGIIGVVILAAFFVVLYGRLRRVRFALRFSNQQFLDTKRYYWEIFAVLAITAIFISAQGEGRFLEDPYLWILTGYLTAVRNVEEVS